MTMPRSFRILCERGGVFHCSSRWRVMAGLQGYPKKYNRDPKTDFLLISHQPCCFCQRGRSLFRISSKRAMSKANQQEHVSLLSSAKNGLVYLTANDWALIADKATTRQFKKGERLVERDKLPQGVYLLLKGSASVEIAGQGKPRSIGPGEICGEISFLDDLPTTADVTASGMVEAYFLDRATLQSMFELFPHLGSRFYRSLATILSRRMRGMIGAQGTAKEVAVAPSSTKIAPAK